MNLQIGTHSTRELLVLFGKVLEELRTRGVVRSTNNPVADYAESLAARGLSLSLLPKSSAGCDAVDKSGRRFEVKARRTTPHNASTQLSAIRGLEQCHFDFLVGVLFNEVFAVERACVVPHDVVVRVATFRQHVNAWILHLRPQLWKEAGVEDVTDALREAQKSDGVNSEA